MYFSKQKSYYQTVLYFTVSSFSTSVKYADFKHASHNAPDDYFVSEH